MIDKWYGKLLQGLGASVIAVSVFQPREGVNLIVQTMAFTYIAVDAVFFFAAAYIRFKGEVE